MWVIKEAHHAHAHIISYVMLNKILVFLSPKIGLVSSLSFVPNLNPREGFLGFGEGISPQGILFFFLFSFVTCCLICNTH